MFDISDFNKSEYGINGNKRVLHIPQNFRAEKASPFGAVYCHIQDTLFTGSGGLESYSSTGDTVNIF